MTQRFLYRLEVLVESRNTTTLTPARTEDRQGRDSAETRHWFVLDVARGMELRAGETVRFARGTARKSPWCALEHRVIDCGVPLPFTGESEVVIMIADATEEMHRWDRVPDLKTDYERALGWYGHRFFS